MALHCYFSYEREQRRHSENWLSASQARRRLGESHLFRPEYSHQDCCDAFEDSIDDPLTRNPSTPSKKRKVAQMNAEDRHNETDNVESPRRLGKYGPFVFVLSCVVVVS
jgi:hypothetical protein